MGKWFAVFGRFNWHNKFWYESVALLCRLHKSCTSVWDAGCAFLGMHFQMLATLILWVFKPTSQRAKKLRDRTRILKALHDWRMILDMSRTREIAESPVVLSVGLGCHCWGFNKDTVWHSEHMLPCLQLVPPPSADHFHPSRCGQRVLLKTFYPGKFHASTTDNKKNVASINGVVLRNSPTSHLLNSSSSSRRSRISSRRSRSRSRSRSRRRKK